MLWILAQLPRLVVGLSVAAIAVLMVRRFRADDERDVAKMKRDALPFLYVLGWVGCWFAYWYLNAAWGARPPYPGNRLVSWMADGGFHTGFGGSGLGWFLGGSVFAPLGAWLGARRRDMAGRRYWPLALLAIPSAMVSFAATTMLYHSPVWFSLFENRLAFLVAFVAINAGVPFVFVRSPTGASRSAGTPDR